MRHLSATVLALALCTQAARAQQPFERLGVKVPVLTLSNGRYPEFFPNDSLRRVGSVVYNRRLHRIAYLLPADSLTRPPAEVTSRWFSPDPLAEKEMYSSPYVFVNNNPVNKFDPDGRSGIASIDRKNHTVTVSSTVYFYGPNASAQVAARAASDAQNLWNAAGGHVKIGRTSYSVHFKVTGIYKADVSEKEVKSNKSYENNYVKVSQKNEESVSYMDPGNPKGANTGDYLIKNLTTGPTTAAHEMGHGWGEVQGTEDGHPANLDIRGAGQPSIMYPRGTIVDPEYQYDPKAPAGEPGGTLNPETRKVTQADIDQLGLDKLKYGKDGKANLGGLTNQYHP